MGILCNQIYFPASKKFPRAKVLCQNQGEAWEVVGLPNDGISIFKKFQNKHSISIALAYR